MIVDRVLDEGNVHATRCHVRHDQHARVAIAESADCARANQSMIRKREKPIDLHVPRDRVQLTVEERALHIRVSQHGRDQLHVFHRRAEDDRARVLRLRFLLSKQLQ